MNHSDAMNRFCSDLNGVTDVNNQLHDETMD